MMITKVPSSIFIWLYLPMKEFPAGSDNYCSKLTIERPEEGVKNAWRRSGVFIVNFERISHLVLKLLLLILSK